MLVSLFQWLDTEEGMTSMKASDEVAATLEGADLDAEKRRILWPDGRRLTIDQAARRILKRVDADLRVVETHVICWMEMRFEKKGLDCRHMEAFDAQLNQWIQDHKREKSK